LRGHELERAKDLEEHGAERVEAAQRKRPELRRT
jgi:hypothetical protein